MNKKINRRHFFGLMAAGTIAGSSKMYSQDQSIIDSTMIDSTMVPPLEDTVITNPDDRKIGRILPPALKKGDKIAITATSSPTTIWEMRHSLKALRKLGFVIEIGDTIKKRKNRSRYLSAPDELRASEFMEFVQRDDINCILFGRGGYGVTRILDMFDFDIIKNNPKVILGFSDVTALLNPIYNLSGLVCFHGPVAASTFNQYTMRYFKKVLMNPEKFEPIKVKLGKIKKLVEGKATGILIGGNLSMLASTLGTPYEIDTKGAILFIEEVSEHPYKIDRMLTQLRLAGKFDDAKAIVFGDFSGLNTKRPFYPGGSFTIGQVLDQIIPPIGKPSLIGLPIGHVKNKLTLPIGTEAEVDINNKTLTILENSVV